MNKFICLGFILIPFNNFPCLKIEGVNFIFIFLWATVYIVLNIIKKTKIKNNQIIKVIYIFLFLLNLRLLLSIFFITEIDDLKPILRELLYSNVWCLTFIYLYSYLKNIDEKYKEKLLRYSIISYFITNIIETLNFYFKFYTKHITFGTVLPRINPLSTESSYFILNFVLIVAILVYIKKSFFYKLILLTFLLQMILTFSTTGIVSIIMIGIIYLIMNYRLKKIYTNLAKIFICIIASITIAYFINNNIVKKIEIEIFHQVEKVIIYIKNNKKGDYSSEVRKKVKFIFGKNLFLKSPIIGLGNGSIYRFSKYNKISFDNEINADAKNVYWTILAEQGILGLSNYIFLFFNIFACILKQKSNLTKGMFVGMSILVILFNGYNTIWIQSIWLYLALGLSGRKDYEYKI